MRKVYIKACLSICVLGFSLQAFAGNRDRTGQAGATELLINPWGQSTGVFGMNVAQVKGIDAFKTNIAGLADVEKTEIGLGYTNYLSGSGVSIANLGFAQKMGDFGTLGANVMTMSFGDIPVTDFNNPEGQIGTYNPQFFNVNIGYAKDFSNAIQAGIGVTMVSEQINSVKANGMAFEAGIQYVSGKRDNFHFGVTLRNIGTNMRFTGSGFSINSEAPQNTGYEINRQTPTEKFEMPTYLSFGGAYDFFLDENKLQNEDDLPKHRLTVMANFTSNSFFSDFLGAGAEYSFKEMFMVRAAYRYENRGTDNDVSGTFYTGLSAGASVQQRIGEAGPRMAIDYSYRPTQNPASGVHTFSLRFMR